jgi:hypothetical protein
MSTFILLGHVTCNESVGLFSLEKGSLFCSTISTEILRDSAGYFFIKFFFSEQWLHWLTEEQNSLVPNGF